MTIPSQEPEVWTVIKLLRDVRLPRFHVFEGETWTTYKEVGERYELGAGMLTRGSDFEVVYQGERGRTWEHETTGKVLARCKWGGCRGCETCGGQFAEARP